MTNDDEREALIASYEGWDFVEVALNPHGASRVIADLANRLDRALRRSEVPEPSAEHVYRGNRSHDTCWVMVNGEMCGNPIEAHPEPQGEPSAAQVRAAVKAWGQEKWFGLPADNMTAMRAALRAASAVTEQGENR